LYSFSPDTTMARHYDVYGDHVFSLYDVENNRILIELTPDEIFVGWIPDGSGFLVSERLPSDKNGASQFNVKLFNRNAEFVETVTVDVFIDDVSFSPDYRLFAFASGNDLYLADMESKTIYDLCFEWNTSSLRNIAWSPDGNSIAFVHDRYPLLLNVETLEMEVLLYETHEIIGWYAVE
jgi:WD40 repeat protein